jgi:hypothetical protein
MLTNVNFLAAFCPLCPNCNNLLFRKSSISQFQFTFNFHLKSGFMAVFQSFYRAFSQDDASLLPTPFEQKKSPMHQWHRAFFFSKAPYFKIILPVYRPKPSTSNL